MPSRKMVVRPQRDYTPVAKKSGSVKSSGGAEDKTPTETSTLQYHRGIPPTLVGGISPLQNAASKNDGDSCAHVSERTQRAHERMSSGSPSRVDVLLAEIEQLSLKERKELLDKAAMLNLAAPRKHDDRDIAMWTEGVYQAFTTAIGGAAAAGVGVMALRKLLAASNAWEPVSGFMSHAKLVGLDVTTRYALYLMLGDLLVKHARRISRETGAPFTAKMIANCCNGIAGVFDKAFPGYLESGMAGIIAKQMYANQLAKARQEAMK